MDKKSFFEFPKTSVVVNIFQQVGKANYFDIPIIFLILFHFVYFSLILKFRSNIFALSAHFSVSCCLIYLSSTLNYYLFFNWKRFLFSENYFDPEGDFIFTFWVIPMSLAAINIIYCLFIDLCKTIAIHQFFDSLVPDKGLQADKAKYVIKNNHLNNFKSGENDKISCVNTNSKANVQ